MKKIFVILLVVVAALTLSACGPNSRYFNLKNRNFYYYKDQSFALNPYDLLSDTLKENDELKQLPNSIRKNLSKYYYVEVEYRLAGERDYKAMGTESNDDFAYLNDGVIYTDNPRKDFGNNKKYDFKIHYLDNETKSEETMLNVIGVFSFIQSPANAVIQEKSVSVGETYNLLDNIEEKDAEGNDVDFTVLYTIEYDVSLDGSNVSVTDDGDVTIADAGTYDVTVVLTQVVEESADADATSSASQSGGSDAMILTIVYKIIAE